MSQQVVVIVGNMNLPAGITEQVTFHHPFRAVCFVKQLASVVKCIFVSDRDRE